MNLTIDQSLGLLGLLVSILGVASGFFLYFFDFRKKLDEIAQRQERSLIESSLDIARKMDDILRKQEGVLTKFQADHLADLYLDAIKSRLNLAVDRYAANDLNKHLQENRMDAVVYELEHAYDMVVRRSIRPMVSPFKLRGDHMFDELVSSVNREGVNGAFSSLGVLIRDLAGKPVTPDVIVVGIRKILQKTGEEGARLIRARIEEIYSPSRSHNG